MSLEAHLAIKKRNRARKQLRKIRPHLIGQRLEAEVDRVLNIADSGKMDWASLVADSTKTSDYPDSKSVKYEDFKEIAKEFRIRPYILYWHFIKKVAKLQASGRGKSDYRALAVDLAPTCIGVELDFDTKIVSATIYAKDMKDVMLTRSQAESMIMEGKL